MFSHHFLKGRHLYDFAFLENKTLLKRGPLLTICVLVDSSTVICWMHPLVILWVSGLFCPTFIPFLVENPVSK